MANQGEDNKYYFLNAELLISYMLEVFPAPNITVTNADIAAGETPQTKFGLNRGIYGMLPLDPVTFKASGHSDLFYIRQTGAGDCAASCYWNITYLGTGYLWILN